MQGLLRNPLAEPGILGVSSCAGLGAVLAIYFGVAALFPLALPFAAIGGAVIATAALFALSRHMGTPGVILSGVAINTLALALTSLAMSLSPNPYALSEIVYWLMGSLKDKSFTDVMLALPFASAGVLLMLSGARGLDALSLGEETAASLGVSLPRLRLQMTGGIALAVGACVAVSGAIGFIGLVVPHLLRPLVGYRPSALLPASACGGALLLTLADLAVRLIPVSPELMIGVVTAFIGAPFFLYVIARTGPETP
jgi:iron complex transport system permease protein